MRNLKLVLPLAALLVAVVASAFTNRHHYTYDTRHFRLLENDINFSTLKDPGSWEEVSLPITGCSSGDLPCVVSVENLQDYGGIYSPGMIDVVDFARFLELQGSANAQDYVTGPDMEASKD